MTLEWYRQEANWLVGLSTGAIAAGLGLLDGLAASGVLVRALLTAAGLLFLVALFAGTRLYVWLNQWGSDFERIREEGPTEASRASFDNDCRQVRFWHALMVIAFPAGVVGAALVALLGLWGGAGGEEGAGRGLLIDAAGQVWQVAGTRDTTLRAWPVPPGEGAPRPAGALRVH